MRATLARTFSAIGREAARIVLPAWCVACESPLPWRERVASCCTKCWSELPYIGGTKCNSCALPLAGAGEMRCLQCLVDPLPLDWCDAWGHYRGRLERVLHAFKFQRHDFLDDPLAKLLEETMRARGDLEFDALVAVPMSPRRERQRGYNQAELLARALSTRVGIHFDGSLLLRRSDRARQSALPRDQRAANVRRAFAAAPAVKGSSVLVIDDICTTGETLRACARQLVRAGATRVCALSVAKVT